MNPVCKALAVVASLWTSAASAIPYFEIGDAGEALVEAQGIGTSDVVYGSIDQGSADLFSFYWDGGSFAIDTFGSAADTQLFLFNVTGQGVWANDQASGTSASQILDAALAAGQYYVGVSVFDYDPYSSTGVIFPSAPFNGQFAPSNLLALDHWAAYSAHTSGTGDYVINIHTASVPEPAALTLFFIALAGLAAAMTSKTINPRQAVSRSSHGDETV